MQVTIDAQLVQKITNSLMVTFRNNNNGRRNNFRRNDRGFKSNIDRPKFRSNFS